MRSTALSAASLAAAPFGAMLSLSWIWEPTAPLGRAVSTAVLGMVILGLTSLALPRRRSFAVRPTSELRWETALDFDDPYRVLLDEGGTTAVLFEHDDPAVVVRDVRRVLAETGARLQCPPELEPLLRPRGRESAPLVFRVATRVVGPRWLMQRRVATATLGGAAFVLVVFLFSARVEHELSALSIALPLVIIALVVLLGAALATLRVEAALGPDGLHVDHVVFGVRRRRFEIPAGTILGVSAVGHAGYPERDLVIETTTDVFTVSLAEEAARRVAALARANQSTPENRPRSRGSDGFESSHALPP